jgi:dihydroorotase-like cyclic amidohydrolase
VSDKAIAFPAMAGPCLPHPADRARITRRLIERGHNGPYFHSVARPQIAETEATYRVISIAELCDAPILIVHMSSDVAIKHVRDAQSKGLSIHAETCPHYLYLLSEKIAAPDFEGTVRPGGPPHQIYHTPVIAIHYLIRLFDLIVSCIPFC